MNAINHRLAPVALRTSYVVFLGFLSMMVAADIASGLSDGEPSMVAGVTMYLFALGWQVLTVWVNRGRFIAWALLFAYLAIIGIPVVAIVLDRWHFHGL